jgi:hydrophobe/amphiphile efflux-3 (HAE3) family protein
MIDLSAWVAHHPKISVSIILAITGLMIFSMYANGIGTQFNEESFQPNIAVVETQKEINTNFTAQYTVEVMARSINGNLLDAASLTEIFTLEEALLANNTIRRHLAEPTYLEGNVISLPTTLAATRIVAEAMLQGMEDEWLLYYPYNISQMRRALLGEPITIYGPRTINLSFIYTPNNIKQSIRLLSSDPMGGEALEYIARTLTTDFNLSAQNLTAQGCVILIFLDPETIDKLAMEEVIEAIVEGMQPKEVTFATIGNQLINDKILTASNESMQILMPLALLMIIVVLIVVYRTLGDTLVSLLALAFSIIWMYGFGAALGFEFNPMTTAIPILIIGLGIDYGIHLTMRYREEVDQEKHEKVRITLMTVGTALFIATLTTMVAFLSNLVSPIKLLREFGILCAFGILASFIVMLLFVPAVRQLRRDRVNTKGENGTIDVSKRFVNNIVKAGAVAGNRRPTLVITLAIIVTLVAGGAAMQLETRFDMEAFLPEDLEIAQDLRYLLTNFEFMGGEAPSAYILIKGDVTDPIFFSQLSTAEHNIADTPHVLTIDSRPDITSIATVMHTYALESNNGTFTNLYFSYFDQNRMPKAQTTSDNITDLYDWLYAHQPQLITRVLHKNGTYDATLVDIATATGYDTLKITNLYDALQQDAKAFSDYQTHITGEEIANVLTEETLNQGQITSLIITIITSFILLATIFYFRDGSLILGIITAIPIIFCVGWILGAMYLLGLSLNVMTITISSLTIGLGVTYGIHISHRFIEELDKNDIEQASYKTVQSTGLSLLGAATTTIAGFGLLTFALMPPLQQFGQITALTILFAFISSVYILPSFLILWARRTREHSDDDGIERTNRLHTRNRATNSGKNQ